MASPQKTPKVTFADGDAEEIAAEFPSETGSFAQAMLEQSKALTMLVSQLAANSTDPLTDMSGTLGTLSSKGAAGRARLQAELASHKGTFFLSVMQSMARRMQPGRLAETDMADLRSRGVTATQYLERFGGFGRTRDLGFIIWQVALCMNYMQEENFPAAKDVMSLLFVCLEQSAMDNGNMQVGLLLSLTEDPPHSLFSQRSVATMTHPRPFAPTANQRWVTTALAYLKEMDLISTRRSEISNARGSSDQPAQSSTTSQNAAAASKKKPKGKGGKGKQNPQTEEEN